MIVVLSVLIAIVVPFVVGYVQSLAVNDFIDDEFDEAPIVFIGLGTLGFFISVLSLSVWEMEALVTNEVFLNWLLLVLFSWIGAFGTGLFGHKIAATHERLRGAGQERREAKRAERETARALKEAARVNARRQAATQKRPYIKALNAAREKVEAQINEARDLPNLPDDLWILLEQYLQIILGENGHDGRIANVLSTLERIQRDIQEIEGSSVIMGGTTISTNGDQSLERLRMLESEIMGRLIALKSFLENCWDDIKRVNRDLETFPDAQDPLDQREDLLNDLRGIIRQMSRDMEHALRDIDEDREMHDAVEREIEEFRAGVRQLETSDPKLHPVTAQDVTHPDLRPARPHRNKARQGSS